ncbi:putative RING-H2 finger protein ATL69 [Miscanthus floridulus]|uniref:putative RING-H2 finger protein ATL69 n=1 Tax=Miscanthus floridulus TaxID=154761 RepID=UPI003458F53A
MPGASASTTAQYAGIGVFVAIVLYVLLDFTRRCFNSVFLTRRHDANADAVAAGTGAGDAVAGPARPRLVQALGLRPDDVAVLPTFTYRAAASPDSRRDAKGAASAVAAADCCSVCLDELREGALVRMLPSCKHYFHAECVDVWLLSHATCPVCRGSPGPEKVRLGVASLSPPLPQLRRFGALSVPVSPEGGETSGSGAKHTVSSRSPSPVRSPTMHFELMVANLAMSPSLTRSRTPDSRMCRTRTPSPATLESHDVGV